MTTPQLPSTATGEFPLPVTLQSRAHLIDAFITGSATTDSAATASARLLLLRAPSGYGKTHAIADWIVSRPPDAPPVPLLYCSPGEADRLLTELDRILAAAPEAQPVTIVIDDYHHASTPENDLALPRLASRSPRLTLIVAARRVHVLDSPISSERPRIRVIGPEELALTPAEISGIAERAGGGPGLRAALDRTGGWPLAAQAAQDTGAPNPVAALTRFALAHLEIVSDTARRILLTTSLLDAIDLEQAAQSARVPVRDARAGLHQLLELGLLVPVQNGSATDYRCHPAVKSAFGARARRSIDEAEYAAILIDRAERVAPTAPFTAFKLFCAVKRYDRAEPLLAQYFTTITDEVAETSQLLRSFPESVLSAHTTFCAARLFLDGADPAVSSDTVAHLAELLRRGLTARLASTTDTSSSAMGLSLRVQAASMAREVGEYRRSRAIASDLEAHLAVTHEHAHGAGEGPAGPNGYAPGPGSFAHYYRELALTALTVGDYPRARLNWQRLRAHAESQRRSRVPFPSRAGTRTVSDAESGGNWLLAALGGMAVTEMIEGDMVRCAALLDEADAFAESSGAIAPPSTWIPAEIARAHLAYERQDEAMLQRASDRLNPVIDRIEAWPLVLIAQAECTRYQHGVHWAHAELRTALQQFPHSTTGVGSGIGSSVWHDYLTAYEAMLSTLRGNFTEAATVLSDLAEEQPLTQIECARISVFSGDDVGALLRAQGLGNAGLTHWQRIDRSLIAACAAWNCGNRDEAFTAMRDAAEDITGYAMPSMLRGVPYETLREVGEAARDAGVCDLTALIDAVPEPARCLRYGRLTEMELRSLTMVAEHSAIGQAAAALYVTPATVKKHLNAVYRKLHVSGRQEAILQARRMGLLPAQ